MNAPWRTGRKLGRTLYQRTYTDGPSDDDKFLGIMDTREDAERVAQAINAIPFLLQRLGHKPECMDVYVPDVFLCDCDAD